MRTHGSSGRRADSTRAGVRDRYRRFAAQGAENSPIKGGSACCGGTASGGCCAEPSVSVQLGYAPADLAQLPEGANLGLGCGNPTGIAALRRGQTVLDLGSGGGIDCFLAAKKVGSRGRVIGVDMTPEMVAKARENGRRGHYANVEFRLGEIEHLPVADHSVDVVISNCVINLAPDKALVYEEAFRVLRPGGRLAISDVVATRPISAKDRANIELWASCSSGALQVKEVKALLNKAGFTDVEVKPKSVDRPPDSLASQASLGVVSADISATKPRG